MRSPAVSHELWEKTRGLAQIRLGTFDIDAGQLSLEDKVIMLIEAEPAKALAEKDLSTKGHTDWPDGVTVPIFPDERDRRHRPEVSDATLDELDAWVKEVYPNVPVDSLAFEDKLNLLVDSAEEFYRELDCTLSVGEPQDKGGVDVEDVLGNIDV